MRQGWFAPCRHWITPGSKSSGRKLQIVGPAIVVSHSFLVLMASAEFAECLQHCQQLPALAQPHLLVFQRAIFAKWFLLGVQVGIIQEFKVFLFCQYRDPCPEMTQCLTEELFLLQLQLLLTLQCLCEFSYAVLLVPQLIGRSGQLFLHHWCYWQLQTLQPSPECFASKSFLMHVSLSGPAALLHLLPPLR